MTTDWRALCEELTHEVEQYAEDRDDLMPECANRARAALAQPEPEVVGPSDEELQEEWGKALLDTPRASWSFTATAFARAVLARWGRQPAPPAEGEDKAPAVTEVIAWLRTEAEIDDGFELAQSAAYQRRAADLLSQRHPAPPAEGEVGVLLRELRDAAFDLNGSDPAKSMLTRAADLLSIAYATGPEVWEPIPLLPAQRRPAPVPVAERLPGPEDCDADGRCWLLTVEDEHPQWRLHSIEGNQPGGLTMIWVPVDSSPGVMVDAFYASHWLPFTALPLPLPQGEGE